MPNEVMEKLKGYPTYKESGLENTGTIPEDWSMMKLKYLTHQIIDGTHYTPEYQDNGIPFLRVTDIHTKEIDLSKVKYITLELHQELTRRCKPEKGNLLLSKNGTIGVTRVIDWDFDFSIFVSLCLIKFKADIFSPQFFSYLFQSQVIDQQLRESSKTTTVTNLHLDKISELFVVKPSLPDQHAIANFLDRKTQQIDELIRAKERKIELLGEYRASLIHQAVTKGLDPNVEMKPSGVDWIAEIPKNWNITRLKYVSNIPVTYGLNIESDRYTTEGIRFIRITDIDERGDLRNKGVYLSGNTVPHSQILDKYDLLLSRSGSTVGKSYLHLKQGEFASAGYLVRFNFGDYWTSKYIYYVTLSQLYRDWIEQQVSIATIKNVNGTKYSNFEIPFPLHQEQKHIVDFLDHKTRQIDELRSNEEQTIKLLKEYRQSLISAVVTGKIDVRNEV